jgi:diguanylate cyclase (GGDEF)-like protein
MKKYLRQASKFTILQPVEQTPSLEELKNEYEKKIFDLQQLIEISRSLNSSLDFAIIIDSILYICMGQLRVLNAGLFIKDQLEHSHFSLHRNYKGFEIDHSSEYVIAEESQLMKLLKHSPKAYMLGELAELLPSSDPSLEVLRRLTPSLIIPLAAKGAVNGILVLGEGMDGESFCDENKEYIMTIGLFAATAIQNASLYEMATTDMMTRLKLRHYFLTSLGESFERAARSGKTLSVIMLDIDHFKLLNDTYGHSCGDCVLVEVANIIRASIRSVDVAARYGGEEFIILLPEADGNMASTVAERIRSKVETTIFRYEEENVRTSISIGVAELTPEKDFTSESLIKRADMALYQSKEHGRNRVTRSG